MFFFEYSVRAVDRQMFDIDNMCKDDMLDAFFISFQELRTLTRAYMVEIIHT
jgi:hypothetical protein